MKGKIVFFLLGATVATIAYLAGDMNLTADNSMPEEVFEGNVVIKGGLLVRGSIIVNKSFEGGPSVQLMADDKKAVIATLGTGQGDEGYHIVIMAGEVIEGSSHSHILLSELGEVKLIEVD